jgi:uncharacterized membrane protein
MLLMETLLYAIVRTGRLLGPCMCLGASSAVALAAPPSFHGVGFIPGEPTSTRVVDISDDGSTVLAMTLTATFEDPFTWTQSSGAAVVNRPSGWRFMNARLSGNGQTVVGSTEVTGVGNRVFRWNSGTMQTADLPPGMTDAWEADVSFDGSYMSITGRNTKAGNPGAYRWSQGTGYERLIEPGSDPFPAGHRASRISSDGSAIAGVGDNLMGLNSRTPFYWSEDAGFVVASGLGTDKNVAVSDLSGDGSMIVGQSAADTASTGHAFSWTLAEGAVALASGPSGSGAHAVNADGSRIVGQINGVGAVMWSDEFSGRYAILADYLTTVVGLDLTGWTLMSATAISADGLTIAGNGINPTGQNEGWVAVIPAPGTLTLLACAPALLRRRHR